MNFILKTVTAVVVTRNRPDSLRRLLDSIQNQTQKPSKVIVVNDAGTPFLLKKYDFEVEIINNPKNLGSGRSRNLGVAKSTTPWILILDDDVELIVARFIEIAARHFEDPKVAVIFGRKTDVVNNREIELGSFREKKSTGELVGCDFPSGVAEPDILGAMVAFVSKEAFAGVGGYDSIYGYGVGHSFREESDFQKRILAKGLQFFFEPEIVFKHHIQSGGGHGPNSLKKIFWIMHNQVVYSSRHQSFWFLRSFLFLVIEMPRYSWGSGRGISYPAAWLGWLFGLYSVKFRPT